MERASRLLVLSSTAAAFFTYLWLLDWIPGMQVAALVLFGCGAVLARVDFTTTASALAASAFVVPALIPRILGTEDFHGLLIWMAPAAGALLARADWQTWSVPRRWRWPLATWTLLIAVTWPLIAARELDFSLIAAATRDTPSGIAAPAPRMTAGWIAHSVLCQLLGLLWFDLLWRQFGRERLKEAERTLMRPLLVGAAIGAAVAIYQGAIDLRFLSGGIWPNLRRAAGLMLDANAFAIVSALCAPLALALAWRGVWTVGVGAAIAVTLTAGMWLGGSRTALLALGIGSIGVLIAALQRRGAWQARFVPIGALLAVAVLVLAMFVAPRGGNSPNPLQRVFDRLPTPDRASITQFANEMWGRFGYGPAAIQMLREHPIAGVGVASYHVIAADYIYRAERRILPADNAQNWWRHYLAELGSVGVIPAFWCTLLLLSLVWSAQAPGEHREALTVLRAVIAGLGAASLLGVPVQHPAVWFLAAVIVYWATALSAAPHGTASVGPHSRPLASWQWTTSLAIVIICFAAQAYSSTHDLRVPVRAQRTGFPYIYGLTPDSARGYQDVRRTAAHAVAVIPSQQAWLELHVWAPHARLETPVHARVTINDTAVIEAALTDPTPITRFVMVTFPGFVRLVLDTQPTDERDRGIVVAHRWIAAPPESASADQIVR